MPEVNYEKSWSENLESLNLDMLKDTIQKSREEIIKPEEWVAWIEKEGYGKYLIQNFTEEKGEILDIDKITDDDFKQKFGIERAKIEEQKKLASDFRSMSISIKEKEKEEAIRREKMIEEGRQKYRESKQNQPKPVINLKPPTKL